MCVHFTECNGCPKMEYSYENQCQEKQNNLAQFFGQNIQFEKSENQFFYRNKLELAFLNRKLGLRRKENFQETFSLQHCLLMSEKANQVARFLEKKLNEFNLTGKVKYAVLRETKRTNQFLISLVSNTLEIEKEIEQIANDCLKELKLTGLVWILNDTLSDTSQGKLIKTFGENFLEEHFMNLRFKMGHNTFFQANIVQAEKLFTDLVNRVPEGQNILDLYCGVGALTLPLAQKSFKVLGIEFEENSVQLAQENAKLNGIGNAEFIAGSARKVLKDLDFETDFVCLDPPRAGAEKKTIQRIAERKPKKVFYVSCNPVTLCRDIEWFKESNYALESIKGFDFFPNTNHMECLAVLEPMKP